MVKTCNLLSHALERSHSVPLITGAFLFCILSPYSSLLGMEDSWGGYTIDSYSSTTISPIFLLYSILYITQYTFFPLWSSVSTQTFWQNCPKLLQGLLWLPIATSQPITVYVKLGLFSKVHNFAFINSECLVALDHLVMKRDLFTPFCCKFCFFLGTSFHHCLSPFPRSPMNNPGSTGCSTDVQQTAVFSFPEKTHCLYLQLKWDPVYKEQHHMQFCVLHSLYNKHISLKSQVLSESFMQMSWISWSIPGDTKCLFLGHRIWHFVSCFLMNCRLT